MEKQKNLVFQGENEAVCEDSPSNESKGPVGVEPTRDGFAIRCLSHLATAPKRAECSCGWKEGQGVVAEEKLATLGGGKVTASPW